MLLVLNFFYRAVCSLVCNCLVSFERFAPCWALCSCDRPLSRAPGSAAFGRLPFHAHVLFFLSACPLPYPNSPFLSLPFLALPVLSAALCSFSASLPSSSCSSPPVSLSLCHSVCLSLCFSFSSFSHLCFPLARLVSLRLLFCLCLSLCASVLFLSSYFCVSVVQSLRLSVFLSLCVMYLHSLVHSALSTQTQGVKKTLDVQLGCFCLFVFFLLPQLRNPEDRAGREKDPKRESEHEESFRCVKKPRPESGRDTSVELSVSAS